MPYPINQHQAFHWRPFINLEQETVPPFAVMEMSDLVSTTHSSTISEADGRIVFRCKKPTSQGVESKGGARWCFNGPSSVEYLSQGAMTFESPSQVRVAAGSSVNHDPRNAGTRWAPVAGQWTMSHNPFGAFRLISYDQSEPIGVGNTAWVMRRDSPCSFIAFMTTTMPGRAGTTVGTANGQLYYLNGTTLTQLLTPLGLAISVQVNNLNPTPALEGSFILVDLDESSGEWMHYGGSAAGSTVTLIRNESGGEVPRYGILGIKETEPRPSGAAAFLDGAILVGETPLVCFHTGKFAIVQEVIANNAVGQCIVSGISHVKIKIHNSSLGTKHEYAEISDGDVTQLETTSMGSARIFDIDPSGAAGDDVWGVVRLGEHRQKTWRFVLTEDMGATVTDQASADLYELGRTTIEKAGVIVEDDCSIFGDEDMLLANGDCGFCVEHIVDGVCRYFVIQGECPTAA